MVPTIRGLQVTQGVVTQPVQWHILLALARKPLTNRQLHGQLGGQCRLRYWTALWRLQRKQLVMFHVKQRTWMLTATGETLRPILTAIQTCTENQKGGTSDDL